MQRTPSTFSVFPFWTSPCFPQTPQTPQTLLSLLDRLFVGRKYLVEDHHRENTNFPIRLGLSLTTTTTLGRTSISHTSSNSYSPSVLAFIAQSRRDLYRPIITSSTSSYLGVGGQRSILTPNIIFIPELRLGQHRQFLEESYRHAITTSKVYSTYLPGTDSTSLQITTSLIIRGTIPISNSIKPNRPPVSSSSLITTRSLKYPSIIIDLPEFLTKAKSTKLRSHRSFSPSFRKERYLGPT